MADNIKQIRLVNKRRQPCEIMTGKEVLLLGPAAAMQVAEDLLGSPVIARLIARRFLRVERFEPPQPAKLHSAKSSTGTHKSRSRAVTNRESGRKTVKKTD